MAERVRALVLPEVLGLVPSTRNGSQLFIIPVHREPVPSSDF